MGTVKLEIQFDEPQRVYVGGDTVRGNLLVAMPVEGVNGVSIVVKGEGIVAWEESNGRTKFLQYNKECYLYQKINLFNAERDSIPQPLVQSFPFEVVLPYSLPSSFKGAFGCIRYEVQARLERRWLKDMTASAPLQVQSPFDLNQYPLLALAVEASLKHHFWCFWCATRPLLVTLHVPQGCLVPGQVLIFSVRVTNHSCVHVRSLELMLVRETTYRARLNHVTRCTEAVLGRKQLQGEIRPGTTQTWRKKSFAVPVFPYTNLAGCSIIQQKFALKLTVSVRGPHFRFSLRLPVVVGTVPLQQSNTETQQLSNIVIKNDVAEALKYCSPPTALEHCNLTV